jgi:hypothetical protein
MVHNYDRPKIEVRDVLSSCILVGTFVLIFSSLEYFQLVPIGCDTMTCFSQPVTCDQVYHDHAHYKLRSASSSRMDKCLFNKFLKACFTQVRPSSKGRDQNSNIEIGSSGKSIGTLFLYISTRVERLLVLRIEIA